MFKEYKVVISGATSGIGLATARKFLDEGATVIGIGRDFKKTADFGEKFIPCICDVASYDEIEKACKFIEETFGGEVDTFVNNAEAGAHTGIKQYDNKEHHQAMDLLLNAAVQFGRNLYPMLLKAPHKNPSIEIVASAEAHSISADVLSYNLGKTSVLRYTHMAASGFIGVCCNSVCPGYIKTPIFGRPGTDLPPEAIEATYAAVSGIVPLGRIGQPEEVAEATQGATVIAVGRNFDKVGDLGPQYIPCKCDVIEEKQIDQAVKMAEVRFGMLDSLVLNAGAGIAAPVDTITSDVLDYQYKLLLRANVLFVQKCVPLLKKSKNLSISFTASVASMMVDDTFPYNMLKLGVVSLCRNSARTLKNIRCNAICPGLIHTPLMPEAAWQALGTEEALQQIPSRRIGTPDEPAKLFAFLASTKASYISGAIITIDGGWYTTHPRVL
ncbi:SDR family oxidoreductase [Oscillibacter sp.]|uniref:SDR family NAD(P)-dependent oxidoreductase n=1 Tax=Oscillibacter sp. TaxID=1945593 RepID=UPI0033913DDC